MKKYNFLANVQKHVDKIDEETKKKEIGKIVNSLQKPFADILQAVAVKQVKDVEQLIKHLRWGK